MWPRRKSTITAPVTAMTTFLPFEEPRNPPGFFLFGALAGALWEGVTDAVAAPRSIVAVTSSTLGIQH